VGGGTAFIISPDGMAVTNNHVVSDTKASYTAFANDGKKYDVEVIARDATLDIAVIKIKGKPSPNYLSFGDSSTVKLGQTVIAIGNALGEYRNTVSFGVISGLSRSIVAGDPNAGEEEQLDEVLQTDAAINPGNSGGPLLDLSGRVIGMNTAIVSGSENIGFAIPATVIKAAVESVKQHGKILRPYMGVRYTQVTEALKEKNKLPVDYGALIVRGQSKDELAIVPGSPADKAGLVENDIILEIDGVNIDESHTLASLIRSKKVGDVITLNIYHKGETKTVKLTLASAPQ
jgi:serine protease Do